MSGSYLSLSQEDEQQPEDIQKVTENLSYLQLSPKNTDQDENKLLHQTNLASKQKKKPHDILNFDDGDSEERQFSTHFIPIKILGRGAFGKVVMAKEKSSGSSYAVKIISKNNVSAGGMERLMSEAKILSELDHVNIVKFSRVWESETKIFIVMELLLGGTLRQLMSEKRKNNEWFTEIESAQIMHSILSGVAYFHSKSIVHRDLKPDNILIGDGSDLKTVKIADFGLSAAFEAKRSISFTQQCGTLIYMAPEFFIQKTYSKPIDIWSCGIMMYQLLDNGRHPFYDSKRDTSATFRQLIKTSPTITFPAHFSDLTKVLIQNMTLIDPSSRYTANQALTHPWIVQNPGAEVPLTMNEILSTVNLQTTFLSMNKAVFFIMYLKKCAHSSPQLSPSYKNKLKKFSVQKNKEKKNSRKVDIYSDQYLNSIIDLDNNNNNDKTNHSRSVLSDDLLDSPINDPILIPELADRDNNNTKLTSDESPPQSHSSPSKTSSQGFSPELNHRRHLLLLQTTNNKSQNTKITSKLNGNSSSSSSFCSSSQILPGFSESQQVFHRKSSSFHKTTTQQSTEQQSPSFVRETMESFSKSIQNRFNQDQSPESKVQASQPAFHMQKSTYYQQLAMNNYHILLYFEKPQSKLMRRDELNQQITKREKINLSNLISIDQGNSNSPRKRTVQMVTAKPQPNSSSPIKRTYNYNTSINGATPTRTNDNNCSSSNNTSVNQTKNSCNSQNGSYSKPRNSVHEDFSQRYESHLRTNSWQSQTAYKEGNINQQQQQSYQKDYSKDGLNYGFSCAELLTPLESTEIQRNSNRNLNFSLTQNGNNSNGYQTTNSNKSKQQQNVNSSKQANQETADITRIIHMQKAQVAALQIPIHSQQQQKTYQRHSPPLVIQSQKNQLSNFAKLLTNQQQQEQYYDQQNSQQQSQQQQQQVQLLQSPQLTNEQQLIIEGIKPKEQYSVVQKSSSNQRVHSSQRNTLPCIPPQKRDSFSVCPKGTITVKERQTKPYNINESIRKNNNNQSNNTINTNVIRIKRDSRVLSQVSATTTTSVTQQQQNTQSKQLHQVAQKKMLDNLQTNAIILASKPKK